MFGYLDPKSLSVEAKSATIDFINASDAGDVRVIGIGSAEEARRIGAALSAQKTMRISSLEGIVEEFHGTIRMNPAFPGEGLMYTAQNPDRPIPIKLAFDAAENAIPEHSLGIIYGRKTDGAILVCRMAIRPISPTPKMRHDMESEGRRN